MEKALLIFIITIVCLIFAYLYRTIWKATREKLNYEDKKYDYLLNKYKYLMESKDEKVINISVRMPHNSNNEWKVFKTIKKGIWPFEEEKDVEVFSIRDADLEKTIK